MKKILEVLYLDYPVIICEMIHDGEIGKTLTIVGDGFVLKTDHFSIDHVRQCFTTPKVSQITLLYKHILDKCGNIFAIK